MPLIHTQALGRKKPLVPDWSLELPPDWGREGEPLTLRRLISRIVREQVEAFRKRQQNNQFLRVLTEKQIEEGAAKGKITMGKSEVPVQSVDEEAAVGAALQAFDDGLYLVVIDKETQKDLDRQIYLTEESAITFIRLVMLAGG